MRNIFMLVIDNLKKVLVITLSLICVTGCSQSKKDYFSQLSTGFYYWKVEINSSPYKYNYILCAITTLTSKKSDLKDMKDLKVSYKLPDDVKKVTGVYNSKNFTTDKMKEKITLDSRPHKIDYFYFHSNSQNAKQLANNAFFKVKCIYTVNEKSKSTSGTLVDCS